jgi:hypothetical protein
LEEALDLLSDRILNDDDDIGQIFGSCDGSYHVLRYRRVSRKKFVFCSRAPRGFRMAVPAVEHRRYAEVAIVLLGSVL